MVPFTSVENHGLYIKPWFLENHRLDKNMVPWTSVENHGLYIKPWFLGLGLRTMVMNLKRASLITIKGKFIPDNLSCPHIIHPSIYSSIHTSGVHWWVLMNRLWSAGCQEVACFTLNGQKRWQKCP